MIYLASPYSHPRPTVMEDRFEKVAAVTAHLINSGHVVYSPILHFHPIAIRHKLPRDFGFWQIVNKEILGRCDQLWVLKLEGWRESEGIKGEILHARNKGIPVTEVEPSAWLK